MRWKLALVLGLLASSIMAAALVRAQDDSSRISPFGGSGLRSRPTPATPIEGGSQLRSANRSGGLAERLQQIRQSVVEEYTTESETAPETLSPAPESADPTELVGADSTYQPNGAGLPSVLKRSTSAVDAPPAVRSAAMETAGAIPRTRPAPATTATGQNLSAPAGARPLGSPPPGARLLGSAPAPIPAKTLAEEATPIAPVEASEGDYDASTSRRRPPSTLAPQAKSDAPVARQAMQSSDPTPFRPATGSKEILMVGAGPQLRIETLGPKAAVRGRPTPYTLLVSNIGEAAARGVQVQVQSRHDVELTVGQATNGAAEVQRVNTGGAALIWSISELPRGAKAELTINAVSRETRPFELTAAWSCAPLAATAQIEVLEPQLAMTLAGPKDIMFGETKIYTITITNPGTGDAENVMLALAPLSSEQQAPQARNIGTLRAGERKEIPVQLTAREAGLLHVRAEASAEGGLHAEAAEQVMVRRGQIELTAEGPPLKYAGSSAEYQVRVANVGNAAAEELAVGVMLPRGVEYVPGDDDGDAQTNGVGWRIGNLAPGDERIFAFTCVMKDEGEKRLAFQAKAAGDLQASTVVDTRVEALADLKLVVNDPPGPIAVGKEVLYEVRVVNRGTKAAAGVEIAGYFSEGIEPTAAEGLAGELGNGQVLAAPIPTLEAGAEVVLKIRAKAQQPGNHIFRAVVQCANPETRLAAEETTRFFSTSQPSGQPEVENTNIGQQPSPFQPQRR